MILGLVETTKTNSLAKKKKLKILLFKSVFKTCFSSLSVVQQIKEALLHSFVEEDVTDVKQIKSNSKPWNIFFSLYLRAIGKYCSANIWNNTL